MHLKISSAEWRPFCPGRYELIQIFMVKRYKKAVCVSISDVICERLDATYDNHIKRGEYKKHSHWNISNL